MPSDRLLVPVSRILLRYPGTTGIGGYTFYLRPVAYGDQPLSAYLFDRAVYGGSSCVTPLFFYADSYCGYPFVGGRDCRFVRDATIGAFSCRGQRTGFPSTQTSGFPKAENTNFSSPGADVKRYCP